MSNLELVILLLLQLAVILAVCRAVGWLGRRFLGQTQVVMEMVAGVLLGPSLFGWLAPGLQARLFPADLALADGSTILHPSRAILYALAQLGLVLYMFLIGLELDHSHLKARRRQAGAISITGIAVPMLLGALLAFYLVRQPALFPAGISYPVAALFLGAAIAITAFPMLARILHEKGLAHTPLGTTALTAGAIDDLVAWGLLALVLSLFQGDPALLLLALGGGALYAFGIATWGRRAFTGFARRFEADGRLSEGNYTVLLLVLMLCALVTDWIGIYAVFGAFMAGAAMPRGRFAAAVAERTELLTTTLLLPIFFVYSGLGTRIALVNTPGLIAVAALIIATAYLGKGVACALAARWSGEGWRGALQIGALMNARGLMELILLNIGLAHGVITPTLFTILVLMAVLTTLTTSPLFRLLSR